MSNNKCENLQIDLSTVEEVFSLLLSILHLPTSPPNTAVSVEVCFSISVLWAGEGCSAGTVICIFTITLLKARGSISIFLLLANISTLQTF